MKKIMSHSYFNLYFLTAILLVTAACKEEEEFVEPEAAFTVENSGSLKTFENIVFSNESTGATSYLWSFGNGDVSKEASPVYMYTRPGDYTVSLEANGAGGRAVYSAAISVGVGIPLPVADFTVEDADALTVGKPVIFNNLSANANTYLWEFGDADASTSTEESPFFTYQQPGTYTVTLTAGSISGESKVSKQIEVKSEITGALYFIDNDAFKIRKIDLKTPDNVVDVVDLEGFAIGLAYSAATGMLYYSDDDNQKVWAVQTDGTGTTEIASGFVAPRGVAVDDDGAFLYVADRDGQEVNPADAVYAIDLATNAKTVLYNYAEDGLGLGPEGIAYHDGYVYVMCVEIGSEAVWKGSVDGNSLVNLLDYNAAGYGYGITVDGAADILYFDNTDVGQIFSSTTNGADVTEVVATEDRAYGLVVDEEFEKLYWSERNGLTIKSADLDGGNAVELLTGTGDIRGLVLVR